MPTPGYVARPPYGRLREFELGLRPYSPPSPLFKHMELAHARSAVEHGQLQLTPVWKYRDQPGTGDVKDQREGLERMVGFTEDAVTEGFIHIEGANFKALPGGVLVDQNSGARIWNVNTIGVPFDRAYVLCLTPRGDAECARDLDERYNAAIKIKKPIGFFIAVARHLVERNITATPLFGRCVYDGTTTYVDHNGTLRMIPRAFLKRADHRPYSEVRMVFPVQRFPAEPILITVPEIRRYLRLNQHH